MNYKYVFQGLVVIAALIGCFTAYQGARRLYLDYQDFKAVRAFVVQLNQQMQAQQKKQKAAQPVEQPQP